jgi:hypothetical protein
LPNVVGVAGWPCVRDSSGTDAVASATSATFATTSSAAGRQTSATASRSMSA